MDVVMLFCPSFTQPERFLHTDQLITRLRRVEPATCCSHDGLHSHVVEKRDRERVQVRCSGLAGSDLPQDMERATRHVQHGTQKDTTDLQWCVPTDAQSGLVLILILIVLFILIFHLSSFLQEGRNSGATHTPDTEHVETTLEQTTERQSRNRSEYETSVTRHVYGGCG